MKKILFSLVFLVGFANASEALVAVGAGYKHPLMNVVKSFEAQNPGLKINLSAGNMKQVSTLVKNNKEVLLAVGEKGFLVGKEKLNFTKFLVIGSGHVVIIYKKGVKMTSYKDLLNFQKIAMPNVKGAVYGIRGEQFLTNSGLKAKLKDKLLIVSNVPQTASYVVRGEVDAGIVNMSAALRFKDKIGGFLKVPTTLYKPITIGAGVRKPCLLNEACKAFVKYLQTPKAKEIFKSFGL